MMHGPVNIILFCIVHSAHFWKIHVTENKNAQIFSFDIYITKVTNLILCCITLVSIPDDSTLRTETYRNIQCDDLREMFVLLVV